MFKIEFVQLSKMNKDNFFSIFVFLKVFTDKHLNTNHVSIWRIVKLKKDILASSVIFVFAQFSSTVTKYFYGTIEQNLPHWYYDHSKI